MSKGKKIKIGLLAALGAGFLCVMLLTLTGNMASANARAAEFFASLRSPLRTRVTVLITSMGEWFVYVPAALLLLCIPKLTRRIGLPAGVTLLVAWLMNEGLKRLLAIPRPAEKLVEASGYGFPSGHAMNGMAFVSVVAGLFWRYCRNQKWKVTVAVCAGIFILTVGLSRLYLNVHSLSDVLAGWMLGGFLSVFTLTLTERK